MKAALAGSQSVCLAKTALGRENMALDGICFVGALSILRNLTQR